MGVGDYVHARPPGAQPRSRTSENQPQNHDQNLSSRQALAAQARVEVPSTNLIAPVPLPGNQANLFEHYAQQPQPPPVEDAAHRDMFDTDVEGIDDSTIAATSVLGFDDIPPQYQLSSTAQHHAAPDPKIFQPHPSQSHPPQRSHDANWYASFGDNAPKSAGFDSGDAADDAESQLTSVVGDDEQSDTTEDAADYARRYRSSTTTANEPLSKRLQNFWSASRRTYQNPTEDAPAAIPAVYLEPAKASGPGTLRQAHSDSRMMTASQVLPLAGGNSRKVTLPRSMTATPRTRFSPPKPTLLEQLDLTPTRRTSGPRPQPGKDNQDQNHRDIAEEYGLFDSDFRRRGSLPPLSAFDITNIDDLDNDRDDNHDHNKDDHDHDHDHDPINDPFSRRLSVQRISPDSSSSPKLQEDPSSKKRQLEPDYPPEVLRQKSFADLQSEPFDHIPNSSAATPAETKTTPPPPEKMSHLLSLADKDRREFFSGLTMDAWEDYGDLLIDQFSATLTKMKDLRRARRRTAAVFEAEIRRRHELVEEQSAELSRKLKDMKSGGAEVLRGRTPTQ
ncbi:uncharacterized protein BO72DRAFT_440835 [Aspergillus fijiensis CBS 313.89]|uniref:Extracellular mutant protein 11 C-terminal domain-containing protein n=1 Tax=Aspergillus fijiensis CBS 313.89 TaxID=1448319 RepID=A0A8G1RGF2_9EURO|nr:uncharacterized protein BO72DRAFT_440835 [Aspergillus fijiensis CBS 313.89]RAK71907.1 hypothetical protein BO72DRAFT_440835 [Aspergillus fijiensis CBS 313.89]